jgi:hypothetical protein
VLFTCFRFFSDAAKREIRIRALLLTAARCAHSLGKGEMTPAKHLHPCAMGDAGSFICENMSLHQPAADRGANINSSSCTRQISFLWCSPMDFLCWCVFEKNADGAADKSNILLRNSFGALEWKRAEMKKFVCVFAPEAVRPIENMKIGSVSAA